MITDGLMKPMKGKEISADKGNGLFIKEAQKYLEENLGKSTMEKNPRAALLSTARLCSGFNNA